MYINGELQGIVVSTRTIPYNLINIGARYLDYTTWLHNGQLDKIRIWDTALSQTEIRNWMCKKVTNIHPNYANLVAYYNFDSGSGTTLVDQTLNGNDGTLINAPTWLTSSAPIGDSSIWDIGLVAGSELELTANDGSKFKVKVTNGSAGLLNIRNIDEEPNTIVPPLGLDQLSQTNYWGVKAYFTSSFEYEVIYNYDGHVGILDEDNLRLCSRFDSTVGNWTEESATLDTGANTLVLGGQTGTEFILGSIGGNILPIEEFEFIDFSIYLNPTENFLKFTDENLEGSYYDIYDVNGRIIISGNLDAKKVINVENLNKGMYFLQLDKNKRYRFLKQ